MCFPVIVLLDFPWNNASRSQQFCCKTIRCNNNICKDKMNACGKALNLQNYKLKTLKICKMGKTNTFSCILNCHFITDRRFKFWPCTTYHVQPNFTAIFKIFTKSASLLFPFYLFVIKRSKIKSICLDQVEWFDKIF